MNLVNLYRKKSRGVSPVISTVLLIALVIVAGIGVALVLFSAVSTPAPFKVEVISISDFKTTDNDIFIDQFEVTIENSERTSVRIGNEAFELISYENGTSIQGWKMDLDVEELILTANNIMDIPLKCSVDQGELIPENDSIYILVTVSPQGNNNFETFKSKPFIVG
ncbi:MAG: archaellin/type IV pilin N-terminal domain-containing protein, partial [Candidatus Hodarchaeales archaeon]